ncbi:MAG: MFS transporter [Alphaproteobacteria bacterium]|nr:MFS transporter [Alphaproteobacteria bacterium]
MTDVAAAGTESGTGTASGTGTGSGRRPVGRPWFIAGLGVGQIVSWGSLYYSFPLIAEAMGAELGYGKSQIYGATTLGLLIAAVAAYPIGSAIDRGRGRAVMALGSVAGGLLLLGWSRLDNLFAFYAMFAGMGLVQAMTLYEPAFAVVARRFGRDARAGITALTLWGGFASTVFVPLIQFLLDRVGWRDTLLVLALVNLALNAGLYAWIIDPRADVAAPAVPRSAGDKGGRPDVLRRALALPAFWGLALAFTAYYVTFSALTFHLYPILVERGLSAAAIVGVIAIIGPAQVAGRILIWAFGADVPVRRIGVAVTAVFPVSVGILWLAPAGLPALAAFAVLQGMANGVMTIVRGLAVPEMVSREAYGALNGALALPGTVAKAFAPAAAALLWGLGGSYDAVLPVAFALTLVSAGGMVFAAATARRGGTRDQAL